MNKKVLLGVLDLWTMQLLDQMAGTIPEWLNNYLQKKYKKVKKIGLSCNSCSTKYVKDVNTILKKTFYSKIIG